MPVLQQMFSGDLLWVQLCAMCNLTTSTKRTIYISADQQEEDTDSDKYKTVFLMDDAFAELFSSHLDKDVVCSLQTPQVILNSRI